MMYDGRGRPLAVKKVGLGLDASLVRRKCVVRSVYVQGRICDCWILIPPGNPIVFDIMGGLCGLILVLLW